VEHGPLLGVVDRLASEQPLAPAGDVGGLGQLHQRGEDPVVDQDSSRSRNGCRRRRG
jgi:hypothetical protein